MVIFYGNCHLSHNLRDDFKIKSLRVNLSQNESLRISHNITSFFPFFFISCLFKEKVKIKFNCLARYPILFVQIC